MNQTVKLQINVQEPYFSFIVQGKKTVEGRLGKEKFLDLKLGDLVLINEQLLTEVTSLNHYSSFRQMLEDEGISRVLPDAEDVDQGERVYYKFYSQEDESKLGVVAIGLKVLSEDQSSMQTRTF